MSDTDAVKDYVSVEREFLHSISTPLMISMSQLEFIITRSEKLDPNEIIDKIKKAKLALDRVSTAVHERRSHIKNLMNL